MSSENDKYTALIGRIKASQPALSDPQGLVSKTMSRIELLSKKKSPNKVLNIISITSSIAASFLIGLFVFEQFLPMENEEYNRSNIRTAPTLSVSYDNIQTKKPATWNEFYDLIRTKQQQQAFYTNLINKYKTL